MIDDIHFADTDPSEEEQQQSEAALRSHKWTGCQRGGDPTDAGSREWVRYCEVCGMEDTCEDPLPPCPGVCPSCNGMRVRVYPGTPLGHTETCLGNGTAIGVEIGVPQGPNQPKSHAEAEPAEERVKP